MMPYLAAVFERQTGLALPALAKYTKWIKVGSFYHSIIHEREELNHTPHLVHAPVPNMNERSPNEDTLIYHRQEYKAAFQQAETLLATLAKAQVNFTTSLAICREDDREVRTLSLPEPLQCDSPSLGLEMPQVPPRMRHRRRPTMCPLLQRDRKGQPPVRLTAQAAP